MYRRIKTFTCYVVRGVATPGIELEIDIYEKRTIQAIEWFDLRDSDGWRELAPDDHSVYRQDLSIWRNHVRLLTEYAIRLAKAENVDVFYLEIAAILHDIGKFKGNKSQYKL